MQPQYVSNPIRIKGADLRFTLIFTYYFAPPFFLAFSRPCDLVQCSTYILTSYMLELTMRLSGGYVFKRPGKGHVPTLPFWMALLMKIGLVQAKRHFLKLDRIMFRKRVLFRYVKRLNFYVKFWCQIPKSKLTKLLLALTMFSRKNQTRFPNLFCT